MNALVCFIVFNIIFFNSSSYKKIILSSCLYFVIIKFFLWLMMFPREFIDNPSNLNQLFLLHAIDI